MATYFVNAGGSNTAPYDTIAKGAKKFETLISHVTFSSWDIVEVVDNGLIDDSTGSSLEFPESVTVRSYAGNINKPTIQIYRQASINLYKPSIVQNLKIIKDDIEDGADDYHIQMLQTGTGQSIIEGCELDIIGYEAKLSPFGIKIWIASAETGLSYIIRNNLIKNMYEGIHIENGYDYGARGTKVYIANNTIKVSEIGITCYYFHLNEDDINSELKAVNNIITGAVAGFYYEFISGSSGRVQDYNCIYNCTYDYYGETRGVHNLDTISGGNDPKFVDVDDFRLQETSPCIDTGIDHGTYSFIPETDIRGITRPQRSNFDMGAYEMQRVSINYFNHASIADGTSVQSTVNGSALITAIQDHYSDVYFDDISKVTMVAVYYDHQDGRQVKKIIHEGPSLTGEISWSIYARDGTWNKNRIKIYNHDGALHDLPRNIIGTLEDIVHTDGAMSLNVS